MTLICRASFRKNGKTYVARDYGKKAFCWEVNDDLTKKADPSKTDGSTTKEY